MKYIKPLLLTITYCFLIGCGKTDQKRFTYYRETPEFIKIFLNSQSDSVFSIAEPGETWNTGCVIINEMPNCQFESAELSSTQFKMTVRTGGYAMSKSVIKLKLKGTEVIGFWVNNHRREIK